jgi:hypothetical protein
MEGLVHGCLWMSEPFVNGGGSLCVASVRRRFAKSRHLDRLACGSQIPNLDDIFVDVAHGDMA